MRMVTGQWGRKRILAALAAGLLTVGAAQAALAAVPPTTSGAPAKPAPDNGAEEDGDEGGEGDVPARPAQSVPAQPGAAAFTHDEAVDATREGLRRSAIGSGLRRLRLLDYILMAGVGALLLLSIILLVLVAGLRGKIAALTAGTAPRGIAREEEQPYGATPLP